MQGMLCSSGIKSSFMICVAWWKGKRTWCGAQDTRWTKAMKYMLTNLKWCASWMITRQEGGLALHEQPGAMTNPERTLGASLASTSHATPRAVTRDDWRGR
jgi:hypothetical protein